MPSAPTDAAAHDQQEDTLSALDDLKAKAIHEVKLEDGTRMGLKRPTVRECILAGGIPMDVVTKLEHAADAMKAGEDAALSLEDYANDSRLKAEFVRLAIKTIEDEPVSLTVEDVADLDIAVQDEVLAYATGTKSLDPTE